MNRCLKETGTPEWVTRGKTILIQKDSKSDRPQQLQTHNVFTDDVENGTN